MLVLKPQMRKTESVEPMLEIRMQVVTWKRSTRWPMITQPMVDVTLKRMRGRAERLAEAPSWRANDGR